MRSEKHDWLLGEVLNNVTDTREIKAWLEIRDGRRFLVITKRDIDGDDRSLSGWIAIEAHDIELLFAELDVAYYFATEVELDDMGEREFDCEIGGLPLDEATRTLRVHLEQLKNEKSVTLRFYNKIENEWIPEEYECELGLKDLETILNALRFRIDRHLNHLPIGEC